MNSDLDVNPNGNNRFYAIRLLSRSVSIDLILNFFPLQIDSKKLKIRFLGHNTNLMFNSFANSLTLLSSQLLLFLI